MNTIKILIVEDEPLYADQLELLIDKLGYQHLNTLDNSDDVMQQLMEALPDLILMDIHIRGNHDGIELTEMIHQKHTIPVIFITSLQDDLTFNRASRTEAINFLVKPFNELQLQRSIELAIKKLVTSSVSQEVDDWEEYLLFKEQFFVKHRNRLEKIVLSDILYFEMDGHYCTLHLLERKYLLRMSLTKLLAHLPKDQFLQTHRSYIVNKAKIDAVDLRDSMLQLGGKVIPLSKRYKNVVIEAIGYHS